MEVEVLRKTSDSDLLEGARQCTSLQDPPDSSSLLPAAATLFGAA